MFIELIQFIFVGTPKGHPLIPLLADLVMDFFISTVLTDLSFEILLMVSYVEDTLAIIPLDKVDFRLDKFNRINPRMKFTFELEDMNQIPFL